MMVTAMLVVLVIAISVIVVWVKAPVTTVPVMVSVAAPSEPYGP